MLDLSPLHHTLKFDTLPIILPTVLFFFFFLILSQPYIHSIKAIITTMSGYLLFSFLIDCFSHLFHTTLSKLPSKLSLRSHLIWRCRSKSISQFPLKVKNTQWQLHFYRPSIVFYFNFKDPSFTKRIQTDRQKKKKKTNPARFHNYVYS